MVSLQVGLVSFCCFLRVGSFVYFLYALRLLAVLYISFAYQKKKNYCLIMFFVMTVFFFFKMIFIIFPHVDHAYDSKILLQNSGYIAVYCIPPIMLEKCHI